MIFSSAISSLCRAACLAAAMMVGAVHAGAATLDFTFSFSNSDMYGGSVTGIVRGLTDNGVSAATSVEVTSALFGVGGYVGSPYANSWTVENGIITAVEFGSFGAWNTAPAVTQHSLGLLITATQTAASISPYHNTVFFGSLGSDLTFAKVDTQVPLPAAGLMLAAGCTGLGCAAARRRRKAA